MVDFKQEIIKIINSELKKELDSSVIEVPPDKKLGDYAFPCFILSKELKKSPVDISKSLSTNLKPNEFISKIKPVGPYVNFFVKKDFLAEEVLKKIHNQKNCFGKGARKKELVMIESPGPNTNKPLHLGHVRNMILGNALMNIFDYLGYKTKRVDIVNDRGVHICKSMLAYDKFGQNKEPNKKPDHFVGDFYVKYSQEAKKNPELEKEIQEMLVKWENKDKKTRKLWKKMNDWAVKGMQETYKRYGVKMDKAYLESEHYTKGKDIVIEALKKNIFEKDENGNIIVDLEKEKLGKKVVLRADGTSIYMTQDIALGKIRYDDFKMDKMIYVVASEQNYHFKVLFKIFELLDFKFAENCHHLAYGMVYLPEGKMKSREGTVVDADNLADDMHKSAKKEIEKRHKDISEKEIEKRAEIIGMGAIKFFILKYDSMKDFVFNPKESLSFEGETGPYVQYTYARCSSILRKYGKKVHEKVDFSLLKTEEEKTILKLLESFPKQVEKAAETYKPSMITRLLLDLSQAFNEYYHKHHILKQEEKVKKARLLLLSSVRQVLEIGLNLLGIEAPEVM